MLVIERVSWRKPRYAVRDDAGHNALWARRRLSEALTGEIDGTSLQLQRHGRSRFTLESSGAVIATAEALTRGGWTVSADQRMYRLRRISRLARDMELCRDGIRVGSIQKGRSRRGQVLCDLPADLSPAIQTFIGFVVLALWNRATAASGSAAAVATG